MENIIRDYKSKIINNQTLLGIELENKSTNNYGNNLIKIDLIKDGKIVKNDLIVVPLIPEEGLFYVGKTIDYIDYDDIKLDIEVGRNLYEEFYYPYTNLEFVSDKSNEKHLEYKVENNSNDTYEYAILNLVFFNKGELVCGTTISKRQILNGRPYYFEYDIPDGLEYTDIKTQLILPNSNHLLFKAFYDKYIDYEDRINRIHFKERKKEEHKFVDNSDELLYSLNKVKEERKDALKEKSRKDVVITYLPLYIIISIPIGFVGMFIFNIIYAIFVWLFKFPEINDYFIYIPWIISSIIGIIICYIKKFDTTYYKSHKEKQESIKRYDEKIKGIENQIRDIAEKKVKNVRESEERNKEISEYNEKIEQENQEKRERLHQLQKEFEDLKQKYPKYRIIEAYDDIDMGFVDAAISQGAITWESVEMYRAESRRQYNEDEKFKQQMAIEERKAQLIAEQNEAIRRDTEQRKEDAWLDRYERREEARLEREQAAAAARRNDSLVMKRIEEAEKSRKERKYYEKQIVTRIDELKNQEYIKYLDRKYNK